MRIRTVKPEWLEDEKMALASLAARVASIGLILLADDHGRGRGNEEILISRIFPGSSRKLAERSHMGRSALAELCEMGFLRFYCVRGQRYYEIVNWRKHQRVDKPGRSRIPVPSESHVVCEQQTRETPAKAREDSAKAREDSAKARETPAKVRETPAKARETPAKARENSAKARETPAEVSENLSADLGPRTRDQDHDLGTPPRPPSQADGADNPQDRQDPDRSLRSADRDRSPRSADRDRSPRSADRDRSLRSVDRDRSPRSTERDDHELVDLAEFKRWRQAWGIRQEDIARALHCKRTKYSAWERGADECPTHIREQLAQYRQRIESHDADKRLELATAAVTWLNGKTGARYQPTSDQAQSAARQWLKWGWSADRLIAALERACAAIDKQWWRPKTLFQPDRLIRADEDNQANAPIARFGEQTSTQTPTVGHAEPSHPDEFIGGTRDLGPILEKLKRGEQP